MPQELRKPHAAIITLRCGSAMNYALKQVADQKGVSVNAMCIEVLQRFLNKKALDDADEDLHKDQPLDGKFHGRVFRNRDNKEEEVFVVFVPRDKHLIEVLHKYYSLCEADKNIEIEQLNSVQRLIERVATWQGSNPNVIKTPDALPGECK